VCQIIGSIGIYVACGIRILWTNVLNTLIVRFIVLNHNIIMAKNKLCNDLKLFFGFTTGVRRKEAIFLTLSTLNVL
jgi:hypothetical protein